MARILVTGAAGFIGFHVARRLAGRGDEVVGLDNLDAYYDVALKEARLAELAALPGFRFVRADLAEADTVERLFAAEGFERVVNLAAQVGVRYSVTNPRAYVESNVVGFLNVLEGCRRHAVEHLVYASSSSVYGANTAMPFSVRDNVDHPVSLYAASKKSNELMAHAYSHLYRLPTTGLRFFTVYGPWGRPDMAVFRFADAIVAGEPLEVFSEGRMERDFTYVDDVAEAVARVVDRVAEPDPGWDGAHPDPATSTAPYRVYNVGNNRPVPLLRLIEVLEGCLGRTAHKRMLPPQPGDVPATCADIDALERDVGFRPSTPLEEGLRRFVEWYLPYRRGAAAPRTAGGAA